MTYPETFDGEGTLEEWAPVPWRVYLVHRYEDRRMWVTIPAAIGAIDAKGQARFEYPEWSPVKWEEAA
jgi:hypothetical protein